MALFLAGAPFAATAAEPINYTYVEGGYVFLDGPIDGPYVKASYNFGESGFYGFGQYAAVKLPSFGGVNFSFSDAGFGDAGVGYHQSVTDNTDVVGELAYGLVKYPIFSNFDVWRASVGVRSAFTDNFEGHAKLNYRHYSFDGNTLGKENSLLVGGQYKFSPRWSVVGEGEITEEKDKQYFVGVRANF